MTEPLPVEAFASRLDSLLANLQRLVKMESPSHDKSAVDWLGALIAGEVERRSAQVIIHQQAAVGNHIVARWNHVGTSQESGMLLLFHMDTVHPLGSLADNPWRVEDGKARGPGALDMKAGIAILLEVVDALQEANRFPGEAITALFTSDEETGSLTSRSLIEQLASQASLVLCMEPALSDGALKTWRKGVGGFELTVTGRAAHAGADHEQGRNAIEELAHQVLRVQGLTDYALGTTLNVGAIQGGTARNVVPERASATIDLRVATPQEAERVTAALNGLHPVLDGTRLSISGGMNRPPMPRDARMVATFQKARLIAAEIGIELKEGSTGGGSDANFVAPLGVPVLDGLGGYGGGAHSSREYVRVDSLMERAALLASLLTRWNID